MKQPTMLHPAAAPFWLAAIVLLFGAGAAYALWGAARDDEITDITDLQGRNRHA